MNNQYNAILFLGETKKPFIYSDYRLYHNGTGYIVLYNSKNNIYVLCRILDERELINCDSINTLVLKDDQKKLIELPVIIITKSITSFDESDKIIKNQFNYM